MVWDCLLSAGTINIRQSRVLQLYAEPVRRNPQCQPETIFFELWWVTVLGEALVKL